MAGKTPKRPGLDKMGPGSGTTKARFSTTHSAYSPRVGMYKFKQLHSYKISGETAGQLNAERAYKLNSANIDRNNRASRVKTKGTRKGGK